PILELISPPSSHHLPGAGKTSLIYLITALAVLPSSLCSIPIGGHNAAVIILDPLSHFSIARLVHTMAVLLKQRLSSSPSPSSPSPEAPTDTHHNPPGPSEIHRIIKTSIHTALPHIHIFRPQSWPSLLATLDSLPAYLFDSRRHRSTDRRIHALIIEDVDAF
ncbi:uncharacterized protein EI97DRAFT_357581, partial [Westerdykella ornata]